MKKILYTILMTTILVSSVEGVMLTPTDALAAAAAGGKGGAAGGKAGGTAGQKGAQEGTKKTAAEAKEAALLAKCAQDTLTKCETMVDGIPADIAEVALDAILKETQYPCPVLPTMISTCDKLQKSGKPCPPPYFTILAMKRAACQCMGAALLKKREMPAPANQYHEDWWSFKVFDVWGAIGRTISAAVKFFLSDDNDLVAELVYDDDGSSGGGSGGAGGVYNGGGVVETSLVLNAVASSLTDIPAETNAYPADISVKDTSIDELARFRVQDVVKDRAALDQLSTEQWAVRYRAQQRAIQALTDALVMKKAYAELKDLAEGVSGGDFSNYGNASSTVATRRLMLDALLALRKRVIAARIRARAELMEMNMEAVADEPNLPTEEQGTTPGSGTTTSGGTSGSGAVGEDQTLNNEDEEEPTPAEEETGNSSTPAEEGGAGGTSPSEGTEE